MLRPVQLIVHNRHIVHQSRGIRHVLCFQRWTGASSRILQAWWWSEEKTWQLPAGRHTADLQPRCRGSKTTSFSFPQIMWLCCPVEISFSKGVCPLMGNMNTYLFCKSLTIFQKIYILHTLIFYTSVCLFVCACVCVWLFSIFCSIQDHDSGSYFCRASNTHLQRFLTSKRATLTVQGINCHLVRPNPWSTIIVSTFWQLLHSWKCGPKLWRCPREFK